MAGLSLLNRLKHFGLLVHILRTWSKDEFGQKGHGQKKAKENFSKM